MGVETDVDRDVRQDVTDVIVRYATAIDRRDWELFRSCFTDDVEADYGHVGVWHSQDEITEWGIDAHAALGPTMHRITNVVLTATPEGVTSRSYYDTIALMPDRSLRTHAAGYYDDDLVLTVDGWRIKRRKARMVWAESIVPRSTSDD